MREKKWNWKSHAAVFAGVWCAVWILLGASLVRADEPSGIHMKETQVNLTPATTTKTRWGSFQNQVVKRQ